MSEHEAQSGTGRWRDAMVVALWAGLLFGFLEGVVLVIARHFPKLRAPYKVSPDILWAAPLLHIAMYAALAALIWIVFRRGVWQHVRLQWLVRTVVFAGTAAVLNGPGIFHPLSVVVLAAGVTAALTARKRGATERTMQRLGRRALLVPLSIALIFAASTVGVRAAESLAIRSLPAATPGAANVLMVILDTVRRDRIEDADVALTPYLQQLAQAGTRYTDAWAASSWSLPSHATLLTGQYPDVHGADWPELRLRHEQATVPEVLSKHGYVTGAFSGNANWMTPEYLGRGFHRFDVYTFEQLLLRTTFGGALNELAFKRFGIHPAGRGKKAARLTEELTDFLNDHSDRPYFAYVTLMDVNQAFHRTRHGHAFWQEAPSISAVMESYDEGLEQLDVQLARMLEELRADGRLDNTVIVVTSDHGESFGSEAGDFDPPGHGTSLYPEQTRVPLLIVYPPGVSPGGRVASTVSLRALPATIAMLLGVDGQAFGEPLPLASEAEPQDVLMSLRYGDRQLDAVVRGRHQIITRRTEQGVVEEILDMDSVSRSARGHAPSSH